VVRAYLNARCAFSRRDQHFACRLQPRVSARGRNREK
jgi:hypothetical protein